jgi:hypothetical protein
MTHETVKSVSCSVAFESELVGWGAVSIRLCGSTNTILASNPLGS